MEKFIPYDKLSKKKKRELAAQRRGSWGMSPVTRKPTNPKAYDRRKARQMDDPSDALFFGRSIRLHPLPKHAIVRAIIRRRRREEHEAAADPPRRSGLYP